MKVIEPRTLLNDEVSVIEAGEEISKCFKQVKKLLEEKHPDYSEIDLFYAGYILSNPNVKEQFKLNRDRDIKWDNRISMELWRGSRK